MNGWMGGWKSRFNNSLQELKIIAEQKRQKKQIRKREKKLKRKKERKNKEREKKERKIKEKERHT